MKLNVGAGATSLPGFTNVDVRRQPGNKRGHAGDLGFVEDGSAEVIFSHAVFEHVYVGQRLVVLKEWRRALRADGTIVCLGLPDFRAVATAYLARSKPGTTGPVFDLMEAYRYTHGHPEHASACHWSDWDPGRNTNRAPAGYLPQLHKGLFDVEHLSNLLHAAELVSATLIRYAYPGEEPVINLGFVAGQRCDDAQEARRRLEVLIPDADHFCRLETVECLPVAALTEDRLVAEVRRLERNPGRSRLHRVSSGVKDRLRR